MQGADRRPRTQKGGSHWRPSWAFKGPTVDQFRRILANIDGTVLHVCSGPSRIGVPGEITVDLHHPAADVRADARNLPFQEVAAVVMDPPYGEKVWDLPTRQRVCCEALRTLRHGGLFVLHAPWAPRFVTEAALLDVAYRIDSMIDFPHPFVALTVWQKTGRTSHQKHLREEARRNGKGRRTKPADPSPQPSFQEVSP
jgi:SAM-dependent methyltransferase